MKNIIVHCKIAVQGTMTMSTISDRQNVKGEAAQLLQSLLQHSRVKLGQIIGILEVPWSPVQWGKSRTNVF